MYFLDYLERVKEYKLWCIEANYNKSLITRDVVCNKE